MKALHDAGLLLLVRATMYNYDLGGGFDYDLGGGIRYDSEEYRKNILKIDENGYNEDKGRGRGNWGHSGRKGQRGGSAKGGGNQSGRVYSLKEYKTALIGTTTSDGRRIKDVHPHVADNAERTVSPQNAKLALKKGRRNRGDKPKRSVYEFRGTRVIVHDPNMTIVTLYYRGKKK